MKRLASAGKRTTEAGPGAEAPPDEPPIAAPQPDQPSDADEAEVVAAVEAIAREAEAAEAAVAEVSAAEAKERSLKLEAGLSLLKDMGFTDTALNRDVLVQSGYDADRAVEVLIGTAEVEERPAGLPLLASAPSYEL